MPINYGLKITLIKYQRKHIYYYSLITNACVSFAVDCQPQNIEWEKEQKVTIVIQEYIDGTLSC